MYITMEDRIKSNHYYLIEESLVLMKNGFGFVIQRKIIA